MHRILVLLLGVAVLLVQFGTAEVAAAAGVQHGKFVQKGSPKCKAGCR